ncbi:Threonine efflux protein [Hartmannibacter diazotrophicus]|uniref:Threonine efflux protein n=1 Tax=Hartmannibacter diazotrophicus TaxID=1482074 RepID=A0A2C9D896_9HYPH|nr:LysE family translocator [Hartmannibacter diazotrophicus]SON56400.1 Threonine efflux protein [Hartmannibacter diazotrophicus]
MVLDVVEMHRLALVYVAYVVATASPGPSTMAIMGVAMRHGRPPALALAGGVITGSYFWAVLAATGISALLAAFAEVLTAVKIAGGIYLLYLAFKSARSALRKGEAGPGDASASADAPLATYYRRGLLLHLGNPKAVLGWTAIMSLGLPPGAPASTLPAILGGCALLAVTVFGGYALLFSTARMVGVYRRARRWIEGTLALVFGFAGLRLLTARI